MEDAKLLEVFRLAGKVVFAEVVKDRDNRSRGFGVVEMSHPVEAVQVLNRLAWFSSPTLMIYIVPTRSCSSLDVENVFSFFYLFNSILLRVWTGHLYV